MHSSTPVNVMEEINQIVRNLSLDTVSPATAYPTQEGPPIEPQVHPPSTFSVPPSDTHYLHVPADWVTLLTSLPAHAPTTLGLSMRLDGLPPRALDNLLESCIFWVSGTLETLALSLDQLDARAGRVVELFDHGILARVRLLVSEAPTEDVLRHYLEIVTGEARSIMPHSRLTHLELYLGMDACSATSAPVAATTYALMPIVALHLSVLRIRANRMHINAYFLAELAGNAHALTELDLRSLHPGCAGTMFAGFYDLEVCSRSLPALQVLGLDLDGRAVVEQGMASKNDLQGSAVEILRIGCGPIVDGMAIVALILADLFPRLEHTGISLGEEAVDDLAMRKWGEVRDTLKLVRTMRNSDNLEGLSETIQHMHM